MSAETAISSAVEMPVFGSSPRQKDHVSLVNEDRDNGHRGRSWYVLPVIGFLFIAVFVSASFFTYASWRKQRNHPSNLVIVPDVESELVRIQVDGQLVVKRITRDQIPNDPICFNTGDDERFDCHPEPDANQDRCMKRGCCWVAPVNKTTETDPGVPYCFFPDKYAGYELFQYKESDDGIKAVFRRKIPSGYPKEIQEVQLEVIPIDTTRVRIKITDSKSVRYETPYPIIRSLPRGRVDDRKYDVQLDIDGRLVIRRTSNGVKIIDTKLSTMIYTDQLLQLNIKVPVKGFYGIGEHQDGLLRGLTWKRFLLLNRDRPPMPNSNLYGAHPFYLQVEDDAKSHAVFLMNSNIMEIITQPAPGITFRPIGGIFDFYVIVGESPADVIQQYQGLVGNPIMPPYWSMGFHLCKYGYGSLNKTKEAYQRTKDKGIPFDVQWNDIDYMDHYNDFTYDKKNFAGLPEFVDQLHKEGMRYVVIMDAGVSGAEQPRTYPPFDDGLDMDVLLKNSSGEVLYAQVWNPLSTVFPDYTHPRAGEYLVKQYTYLYNQFKFDGSWIDMNEPSNFFEGSMYGCPKDSELEHPPYKPGGMGTDVLASKTVCMSAQHYASTHYNLHNIYGLTNGIATNYALKEVLKTRPFIITRSSFLGQGYYTGHWSGDISSTWEHLKYSLPSTMNFAMYGVSMMGSDICGFLMNTTDELCARWQSVGSFYPFSRNHNDKAAIDQDPGALSDIVVSSAQKSLLIRYRLLPFLYTLFYRAHVKGETVFRPLFVEFPEDKNTHDIDTTFLWGSSFMVVPILDQGVTDVTVYVPKDVWYNYYNGQILPNAGSHVKFHAELDQINLMVRAGHILPCQKPSMTTTASRLNNFELIVALKNGQAQGELYWDDGETLDAYENKQYILVNFVAKDQKLTSSVVFKGDYDHKMPLDHVEIFGIPTKPTTVTVQGKTYPVNFSEYNVLKVKFDEVSLLDKLEITWV